MCIAESCYKNTNAVFNDFKIFMYRIIHMYIYYTK